MKSILTVIALVVAVSAGAQQIIHDKDAQLRNVGDFHSIDVSSAVDLRLSQGEENVVAVSAADPENREGIKTVVKNGVLKVWYEQKKWFRNSGKVRVYVSVKSLKRIEASGACDVVVSGELTADDLSIRLSGASDFRGTLRSNAVAVNITGASDITVRGEVASLNVDASGASHFKGYDLKADNCQIEASGASDVRITVNKVLNAKASGASSIHYQGEGMISDIHTSGASRIARKG